MDSQADDMSTTTTTPNSHPSTVALGRYLWERIHQTGINHIFGVPGDFNLTLLDHIYHVDGLEWIGNTNELNAAYAADGYARVHGSHHRAGAACVVTTHGVGELSALNAIAGSMTEQVKIIHVVGQTSLAMQRNRMMIHHSIGFNPDHQMFNRASREFRVAAAELQSAEGAADEIDRVLRESFVQSGPVYIFVPIDLVDQQVSAHALHRPLSLEPEVDHEAVERSALSILHHILASVNPCIFVDCLVQRHNAVQETKTLVDVLALPVYTSNMGKGIIDEVNPNYVGLYNGGPSGPGVEDAFGKHDFVLCIGNLPSDTNTGGFTRSCPPDITAFVNPHSVQLPSANQASSDEPTNSHRQTQQQTPIKAVLRALTSAIKTTSKPTPCPSKNIRSSLPSRIVEEDHDSLLITQSWIWHRLVHWLQPHDVVFGETGTAAFGIPDIDFPVPDITWITQTYYGSIGYCTPAAMGVDLALRDLNASTGAPRGRTVLCTGDGSLMLTVQEIGNMLLHKLSPVILLINNRGYTIERVIHGAHQSYNDIVPFDYSHLLPFLGPSSTDEAVSSGVAHHRARTRAELEHILSLDEVCKPNGVQLIEIMMEPLDVPWRLATQVAARGPQAVKEMREAGFRVREVGR